MKYALLDILTGEYKQQGFDSIKKHLTRLLNSRQESLQHMPNYGLPDVTDIYQGLPYSIDSLIAAIKIAIETYEPRLKNVIVTAINKQKQNCVLQLNISGETQNERVQFDTYFMGGGEAKIK